MNKESTIPKKVPLKNLDRWITIYSKILASYSHDGEIFTNGLCHGYSYVQRKLFPSNVPSNFVFDYKMKTEYLEELYRRWPEFSGNFTYPVPAPWYERIFTDSKVAAYKAYSRRSAKGRNMYRGTYGKARIRLLKFIIDEMITEVRTRRNENA